MKNLLLILSILTVLSCSKDDEVALIPIDVCQTCTTTISSNDIAALFHCSGAESDYPDGFIASSPFEITACGQDEIDEQMSFNGETITGDKCEGVPVTIRTVVVCQ